MTEGERDRLGDPKVGTDLQRSSQKDRSAVDREETQEKELRVTRFGPGCVGQLGAELWREKGWILGGGVAGGDRGEHAG